MWDQVRDILNQSMERLMMAVASVLPGVLALLLALLLAMALAWFIRSFLRRSLERLHFDEHLVRWGLSDLANWSPSRSPTLLVASAAYWTVILLGLLVGLSAMSATVASQLTLELLVELRHILAALLILGVGTVAARFLARNVLIGAVNMQIQSARLLSLGVKWLVLVLAAAMALEHLGIGGGIVRLGFGILFGGIVLAMALAVGLGSKEMVSRSWERQATKTEEQEEPLHHI